MMAEGNDDNQKQSGKTEYDRSEKKDFCTVCDVGVNAFAVVCACGISDDLLLGVLYRACDRAS